MHICEDNPVFDPPLCLHCLFPGKVTIEILNQLEDKYHVAATHRTDTDGEKVYDILIHQSQSNNTQYLKDDSLVVRLTVQHSPWLQAMAAWRRQHPDYKPWLHGGDNTLTTSHGCMEETTFTVCSAVAIIHNIFCSVLYQYNYST